ncbi:MAG: NADP-dependent oxidoreductase [Acetobacteraceae bacterium]|nr:NADP-dependent oxidoreductase [Acetobacteraceae bacterium]
MSGTAMEQQTGTAALRNRAVRIHRFGGPEVLQIEDVPVPEPRDDEVVVKVVAASINPVDYKTRSGSYPAVTEDQLPVTLGRDLSGTVELLGSRAHTLKKGDPIFAMLGRDRGAYARYVLVKAVEMAAKPGNLDHIQAAAVPLAGITAWQGLFDHGGLRAGQRVLIHGGTGGVGHFAVQFAKARGATVLTTVAGDDKAFARELGADEAIDYKTQRFEDVARDIDVVFDLIGGETQERSWSVLKPGGIIVSTLAKPDEAKAKQHGARGTNFMARENGEQLAEIGRLIEEGKVRPFIAGVFPFDVVQAAQSRLEQGNVPGKIVLDLR